MDKETMDQFQMLVGMMETMAEKMDAMATKDDLQTVKRHNEVLIENMVAKRIDGLFDGYKLTHEKQYELEREFERKTTEMQMQIDNLQARLAALESRIV